MNAPKAVLWDMDGTLINSEELHWTAWRETMANEGIAITREQFLSSFGQRNDSIIPAWIGPAATPEEVERIGEAKEQLYRQLVRQFGIAPGARGCSLVTETPQQRMAASNRLCSAARQH
jgi:beta-phosphoglucomutase-like phosphatase (HAD superfamily)